MGDAVGVATNSKGHVFVYTRTGSTTATLGTARTFSRAGSRLFEFDQNGSFVRELGQGLYGFNFAHTYESIPRTTFGSWMKGRTWSSSSTPMDEWRW